MSEKLKDICISVFIVLNIFVIGFIGGYKASDHFREETQMVDTIYVERWDTITIAQPTEVVRTIVRYDTLRQIEFVNISDTDLLKKLDSLELAIELPISQAIYRDSTENAKYEAYVSGYKAELDSISIHCKQIETIVTKTERIPPRRIGIGIQAGVGYSGQIAPYVGIGIQYRIW